MCGINGIVRLSGAAPPPDRDELLATRDAMSLRGPDGSGLWISERGDVGLGHRRLAIIDLSDAGLQPMEWDAGRYRIVFNGEIYNYRELREALTRDGVRFRSRSDTEVILALYAREGERMLGRLRGMYALAIWDDRQRRLLLARDPYGIKPLYYHEEGGVLRFASQVKALEAGGRVPGDVEPAALTGFLLWGSVPEPFTLRKGVRCLPAGHHLLTQIGDGRLGSPRSHYDFGATPDAVEATEPVAALEDSVRAHLVADVPVAVFLSAGIDSTLVAALAARQRREATTTLTLTFDEFRGSSRDEGPLAAAVAGHLGTRHIERHVRRADFLGLFSQALRAMDQPSIDGFNTYVVSRAAHDAGFKVVLSGLGGDELMGGYPSFRQVPMWAKRVRLARRVPGAGRVWRGLARRFRPEQPKLPGLLELGSSWAGAYFLRRGLFLPEELPELVGVETAREGLSRYDPVADASRFLDRLLDRRDEPAAAWEAVHVMESTQYMRNQLLRDSDWASMAHSLELRVPLVDARLRLAMRARGFEPARSMGKAELLRSAAPELPDEIFRRPKTGFAIPVSEWLEEETHIGSSRGLASRRLALKVLESFGVSLDRPASVSGLAAAAG